MGQTAVLWTGVEVAYGWVHRAARLLGNDDARDGDGARQQYKALLAEMGRDRAAAGALASTVDHFLKVTASYWPGLFHCYDLADLPRTNNDLEHFFASARYHECWATGRRGASPGIGVRGPMRLVAAVATRLRGVIIDDLSPTDRARWRDLRELQQRHAARRAKHRFRRDPAAYLAALEGQLLKLTVPP